MVGHGAYHDERLDALLSITGRMDGYLYRCRNDASYTMLYISDGILTVSGYRPSDFVHNAVRDYVSAIHPDDLASVYAAVDAALEARRNWNVDYRIVPRVGEPLWVREIGGGVWDDAGELEFLEGFVVDISDRKVIEDLNSQLLLDLKTANEELSAQKREIELAKQQSDHSANHDPLTDLPNRRAFHNELKSVVARCGVTGEAAGLLFIDLDRFKEVNDTLGHEAGDALLQRVSSQLRSILRSADFVARLGGDEFAFLFSGDADLAQLKAVRVAERILERSADQGSHAEWRHPGRLHRWRGHVSGGSRRFRSAGRTRRPADVHRQKEWPQPVGHRQGNGAATAIVRASPLNSQDCLALTRACKKALTPARTRGRPRPPPRPDPAAAGRSECGRRAAPRGVSATAMRASDC